MTTYTSRVCRLVNDDRGAYQIVRDRVDGYGRAFDARNLVSLRFGGGRTGAGEEFRPGMLSWSFALANPDVDPTVVASRADSILVGDRVTLGLNSGVLTALGVNVNDYLRAAYYVTDTELQFVRIGAGNADRGIGAMLPVMSVTAVGVTARLAQTKIGTQTLTAATGASRMASILQLQTDPQMGPYQHLDTGSQVQGTEVATLRTVDVDRTDPISLLRSWAADSGALLIESLTRRNTPIRWESIDGRRNRAAIVTLTADEVASSATWSAGLQGLCNRMTLTYGPDTDRREVTVEDPDSIAAYGEFAVGRDTDLLYLADAQRVAQLTVGRNSRPWPAISRLDFNLLDQLPADKAGKIAACDAGDLIELAGLPAAAPYSRWLYVEGVDVNVTKKAWLVSLYVSPAGRTGAPLRWEDVDQALTWAQATETETGQPLTWLAAAGWFDPPTAGGAYRWVDVPTDQMWWQLAPGELRDLDARAPTWASYPADP